VLEGIVTAFAGRASDVPTGWEPCDGRRLLAGAFPTAARILGEVWGRSDPEGFFVLPDFRGYFLRGVDEGGSVDPDHDTRKNWQSQTGAPWVGTFQTDEVRKHNHRAEFLVDPKVQWNTGAIQALGFAQMHPRGSNRTEDSGGNETRPVNAYVYWIIYVGPPQLEKGDPENSEVAAPDGAIKILNDGTRLDAGGHSIAPRR